jgi:hypothetical protein
MAVVATMQRSEGVPGGSSVREGAAGAVQCPKRKPRTGEDRGFPRRAIDGLGGIEIASIFRTARAADRSRSIRISIRGIRRRQDHCCRFPHDTGWTALDPFRTFASVRSEQKACSVRKPDSSTADKKGRLGRPTLFGPFVSHPHTPPSHPGETPQAQAGERVIGLFACSTLSSASLLEEKRKRYCGPRIGIAIRG